jgi:uncharacterized protein
VPPVTGRRNAPSQIKPRGLSGRIAWSLALASCLCGWHVSWASEFANPEDITVTTYQNGVWSDRISIVQAGNRWREQETNRDPQTFNEKRPPPLEVAFRANGNLEVSLRDGSKMVWESPTRLILISPIGQRFTHVSECPIVQFSPELFVADQLVLKAYLSSHTLESLCASDLEDGDLVKYSFVRAEEREPTSGGRQHVWRWGGWKQARYGESSWAHYGTLVATFPFDVLLSDRGRLLGWSDPARDSVTVVQGYEPFSPVAPWLDKNVSQPQSTTVTFAEKQAVPMSDSVSLAATIFLPGTADGKPLPGPFPTVLVRTPYGRGTYAFIMHPYSFASRGYAVVYEDVRGRGDSGGTFHALHDDISDGNDTLNWIAAQPWSDGSVGMFGPSYLGWVQWQAAASGNPHLKTLVSIVPSVTAFGDLPYINGMFMTGMLPWCLNRGGGSPAEEAAEAAVGMKKDLNAIVSAFPVIDADMRATGHRNPTWREFLAHTSLDSYWQQGNILNHQDKIDLPVLHVTGWYDDVLRGTMVAYDMMKANRRRNQQLWVGPWSHAANFVRGLGELPFGPDASMVDMQYGFVRWFDHWLKGVPNHVEADPPVRYFTMGENKWHEAQAWPPKNTTTQSWYFNSADSGAPGHAGQLSSAMPKGAQAPDHYADNPANPVPYLVDIRANQIAAPEDYQEIERRPDTLTYTTDLLQKPLVITGEAAVVLYAATDQRDTDWVVRVTDVFPDGRSISIVEGFLRARFRDSMEREALVPPNKVVRYRVPMAWTSYRFAEGHRMRVLIASAAAGAYAVNTNSGGSLATDTVARIAHQSVYHSERYPSHIEISIRQSDH